MKVLLKAACNHTWVTFWARHCREQQGYRGFGVAIDEPGLAHLFNVTVATELGSGPVTCLEPGGVSGGSHIAVWGLGSRLLRVEHCSMLLQH